MLVAGWAFFAFALSLTAATNRPPLVFGADAAALLQFNGTQHSRLTPVSTLFRIWGDFRFTEETGLFVRSFASGGRNTLHGTPGAFVPVNDIAVYPVDSSPDDDVRPRLRMDSVFFYYHSSAFKFAVGLLNLDRTDSGGVMVLPGVTEAATGFVSGHFTRMLALSFLEKELATSIPAIHFTWSPAPAITLRAGMTFGDSSFHFFIRNSGWLEVILRPQLLQEPTEIRVSLGASDADESGTHRLSPAFGLLIRQPLNRHITLFAGYSLTETATSVSALFGSFRWHTKAGVTIGRRQGAQLGIGCSVARAYASPVSERALEIFWRLRPTSWLSLTPDFQLIHHPAGTTDDGQSWALLAGFRAVVVY